MKFLMIVLTVHLVVEIISNKRKDKINSMNGLVGDKTRHPAEFELR